MGDNGQFLFLGNVISETLGLIARDLRLNPGSFAKRKNRDSVRDGEGLRAFFVS